MGKTRERLLLVKLEKARARKIPYMSLKLDDESRKWSGKRLTDEMKKLKEDLDYFKALHKLHYPSSNIYMQINKTRLKIIKRASKLWWILSPETKDFINKNVYYIDE